MRGYNLSAMFREGSGKQYTSRPPANCVAARKAWDHFAADGPVIWIQLLDGYWGCERGLGGPIEEEEAIHFRRY